MNTTPNEVENDGAKIGCPVRRVCRQALLIFVLVGNEQPDEERPDHFKADVVFGGKGAGCQAEHARGSEQPVFTLRLRFYGLQHQTKGKELRCEQEETIGIDDGNGLLFETGINGKQESDPGDLSSFSGHSFFSAHHRETAVNQRLSNARMCQAMGAELSTLV